MTTGGTLKYHSYKFNIPDYITPDEFITLKGYLSWPRGYDIRPSVPRWKDRFIELAIVVVGGAVLCFLVVGLFIWLGIEILKAASTVVVFGYLLGVIGCLLSWPSFASYKSDFNDYYSDFKSALIASKTYEDLLNSEFTSKYYDVP